ncbi:hypothetical protein [Hyphomicrobium sp. DY-1]
MSSILDFADAYPGFFILLMIAVSIGIGLAIAFLSDYADRRRG